MSQDREVTTPLSISTFESELNDAVGLETARSISSIHVIRAGKRTPSGSGESNCDNDSVIAENLRHEYLLPC